MLKFFALFGALLIASPAAWAQESNMVFQCAVSIKIPDSEQAQNMKFVLMLNDDTLSARVITETPEGFQLSMPSAFSIGFEDIRAGLSAIADPTDLNFAELLIVHAMRLEGDPGLSAFFSSGIDLTQVRSARVITFGETTGMGSTTVVEAMDADGEALGSFLGGFLVAPCR